MKNRILGLLLCISPFLVIAQNQLSGKVVDSNNNEPLEMVNLYFPELETGKTTDENGEFKFESLPSGTFKLIVSYIGYKSQTLNVNLPLEASLSLSLESTAIEMEEIIISTPFHKLQSENVMKVERVRVSDLKEQGLINLSNSLDEIPGVSL